MGHCTTSGGDFVSWTSLSAAMTWLRIVRVQEDKEDKVLDGKAHLV